MKNTEKFLDKLIIRLWRWIAVFVLIMIVTFWVKGDVPDTLIERVLTVVGGEFLCMASITIVKNVVKRKEKEDGDISDTTDGMLDDDESDN